MSSSPYGKNAIPKFTMPNIPGHLNSSSSQAAGLSDETKVGNTEWSILKQYAMQDGYKSMGWFVSNRFLSFTLKLVQYNACLTVISYRESSTNIRSRS